jgi:hypothetical protein
VIALQKNLSFLLIGLIVLCLMAFSGCTDKTVEQTVGEKVNQTVGQAVNQTKDAAGAAVNETVGIAVNKTKEAAVKR